MCNWRRGRDSNPRYPFGYTGFQDRSHQPLGHLSGYYSFTTVPTFSKLHDTDLLLFSRDYLIFVWVFKTARFNR